MLAETAAFLYNAAAIELSKTLDKISCLPCKT